ncbi:uncharacterized protein LOC135195101 isoform X2 [Macrobrachium nipponense]|uniref:uncharacterized protein LOC135195101 isoform X2 n=1 Tax=Macrobrachium nipponense TaxID=159736 RepID=UPI0030C8070E
MKRRSSQGLKPINRHSSVDAIDDIKDSLDSPGLPNTIRRRPIKKPPVRRVVRVWRPWPSPLPHSRRRGVGSASSSEGDASGLRSPKVAAKAGAKAPLRRRGNSLTRLDKKATTPGTSSTPDKTKPRRGRAKSPDVLSHCIISVEKRREKDSPDSSLCLASERMLLIGRHLILLSNLRQDVF